MSNVVMKHLMSKGASKYAYAPNSRKAYEDGFKEAMQMRLESLNELPNIDVKDPVEWARKKHYIDTLVRTGYNKVNAAKELGIHRNTLATYLKSWGISNRVEFFKQLRGRK